jgi:hypothetical protein
MMRLSAALTRRVEVLAAAAVVGVAMAGCRVDAAVFRASPSEEGTERAGIEDEFEESSSQTNMADILLSRIMKGCC